MCDGTNGTPDLRGKFIYGYDTRDASGVNSAVGLSGGERSHTLTVDEIPSHTHSYWDTRQYIGSGNTIASSSWNNNTVTGGGVTGATGSGKPHNIMPPYYVLTYIIKL